MNTVSRKLPLTGAVNLRELGGYPCAGGGETQKRRLLRSDSLHALTPDDKAYLYDYGVRLVLDLRSEGECGQNPSGLLGYRDVAYRHLPLLDHVQSEGFNTGAFPKSMGELYVDLLDNSGGLIADALRTLVACPACAVFNCTAGKDRTGVVSMLLLLAAGVEAETVIADYAESYENLKAMVIAQIKGAKELYGMDIPEYVFLSEPAQMRRAIAHLEEKYDGVDGYCAAIGMDGAEAAALRAKLR